MGEGMSGAEFITHEFNEAIGFQQAIVDAETELAQIHPRIDTRTVLKACLEEDKDFLQQLRQLGESHGATGEEEEIVASMRNLMQQMMLSAGDAKSEAYEAHAVLLTLKRKQQDSGAAVAKLAQAMGDSELRDAARSFEQSHREGSQALAEELAALAVELGTSTAE